MPIEALSVFSYIVAFFILWIGAGLIISSINKLSLSLKIPQFFVSFFILGILTSTPEIAVGLSAISSNTPGIFIGNLLGSIPVLFLMVVPLLAILGKGIKLHHQLSEDTIFLSLLLSISPFFVVLDNHVSTLEGVALILLYCVVAFKLQHKNKLLTNKNVKMLKAKKYSLMDIGKILLGTAIVLFSSNYIVNQTLYFSEVFNIAPFYISIVVLSVGTNLPELALAIRAIFAGQKDIALGDYLGSASANAFLFGLFTLMNMGSINIANSFVIVFIIVGIGLILFFHFARTKRFISPKEGFVLLLFYIAFVVKELSA